MKWLLIALAAIVISMPALRAETVVVGGKSVNVGDTTNDGSYDRLLGRVKVLENKSAPSGITEARAWQIYREASASAESKAARAEAKANHTDATANHADASANGAQGTANAAKTTADKAKSDAHIAQETANKALSFVNVALAWLKDLAEKVSTAQTTADEAKANAKTAQDTADDAKKAVVRSQNALVGTLVYTIIGMILVGGAIALLWKLVKGPNSAVRTVGCIVLTIIVFGLLFWLIHIYPF